MGFFSGLAKTYCLFLANKTVWFLSTFHFSHIAFTKTNDYGSIINQMQDISWADDKYVPKFCSQNSS